MAAVDLLWLIPVLPLISAGTLALARQPRRRLAAGLAIGSMAASLVLSCWAFAATLGHHVEPFRAVRKVVWLHFGSASLELGWVLDPLSACMLLMVSLVGLLIFIYSVGYMEHDPNFTRFFCFLSLFAGAMLTLVLANSLLLLFMAWELVGLSSYLLIGFWYSKPSAAAAAKKAFIVTRIGDLGLLLGMLWLYGSTGTLLFYDAGQGCLEAAALSGLVRSTVGGLTVATAIGLLIFCGAVGKSGQVPLHVWLPDAMEGPTPVSALIHAATMVAAGVFLVARVYPLMAAHAGDPHAVSSALMVVTWVGAITAAFAASIAVAQTDIKRILAYSTVSQLGFMMMGIGVGGYAVGMFHLITHAFFKALLFMGAGSVIHGCHDEQDIRRMGGLRNLMPVTFATYAVGMLALAGFPLFFSGFWSKDEILYSAMRWHVSRWPFFLGLGSVFLTAFYMSRQVWYVFFGTSRLVAAGHQPHGAKEPSKKQSPRPVHESGAWMTVPLVILAVSTILLSLIGTPMWPWFQHYLGAEAELQNTSGIVFVLLVSSLIAIGGIAVGFWIYSRWPVTSPDQPDPLERWQPGLFAVLRDKFRIDELYARTVVRWNMLAAATSDWLDRIIWGGAVKLIAAGVRVLGWIDRLADEFLVNAGFDQGCGSLRRSGRLFAAFQNGQVQRYLKVAGLALSVFVLFFLWGCR